MVFILVLFLRKFPLQFPHCLLCYLLMQQIIQTAVHRCSPKQVFLKILQYLQEKNLCSSHFLIKFQAGRPAFLFKKRLQRRCFSVFLFLFQFLKIQIFSEMQQKKYFFDQKVLRFIKRPTFFQLSMKKLITIFKCAIQH